MTTEVILRFSAKDDASVNKIVSKFYEMCEKEPGVNGWGLIDLREEGTR